MAASTPDPLITQYAPLTTTLGLSLNAGQGSDTMAVLAALGKVEIVSQLLLDVMLLKTLPVGITVEMRRAAVIAALTGWLKEIETAMKTPPPK